MSLTFLKNIRLFNKKDHIPARAHPKRGHSSLLWNPAREDTLTTRMDMPPTRMGKAHPKSHSLPKERSHRPRTPAHGEGFGEGFDKDERL